MVRLSVDDLVADAVEAFKNNECIEEPPEEQTIQVRHLFLFFVLLLYIDFLISCNASTPLENRGNKQTNKETKTL